MNYKGLIDTTTEAPAIILMHLMKIMKFSSSNKYPYLPHSIPSPVLRIYQKYGILYAI